MADRYDLGPQAAADVLGVHVDTIIRWANDGTLPCWKTPGGHRRFRRSDLGKLGTVESPEPETAA